MYSLLYIARLRKGWTQQALAEYSGVSRRTICALEQQERLPTARVGMRICRALGCGFEEVFCSDVSL